MPRAKLEPTKVMRVPVALEERVANMIKAHRANDPARAPKVGTQDAPAILSDDKAPPSCIGSVASKYVQHLPIHSQL